MSFIWNKQEIEKSVSGAVDSGVVNQLIVVFFSLNQYSKPRQVIPVILYWLYRFYYNLMKKSIGLQVGWKSDFSHYSKIALTTSKNVITSWLKCFFITAWI